MEYELNFKGSDPGAVKYGNFINYYQFNSVESRVKLLPTDTDLWITDPRRNLICLDIGCNAGDLTQELYKFLSRNIALHKNSTEKTEETREGGNCYILGIDLDPVLITRAKDSNKYESNITYAFLDYMNDHENVISLYLSQHKRDYFDIICCFSVTMWIHLNHGDEGLKQFLHNVSKQANMLVIESQPWKCYRTAVRRMRRSGGSFPLFETLKMRGNVTVDIENVLHNECNFIKVKERSHTGWGRQLQFYSRIT